MHHRDADTAMRPRPPHPTRIRTLGEAALGQYVVLERCGSRVQVTRHTGEGEHAATWVRPESHLQPDIIRCCPHAVPASTPARAEEAP